MSRPSRLRRVAKWAGVFLSMTVLVAYGISVRWSFGYITTGAGGSKFWLGLSEGSAFCAHLYPPTGVPPGTSFYWIDTQTYTRPKWIPFFVRTLGWILGLPLWIPLLLVATPTGFLFWRDRRRKRARVSWEWRRRAPLWVAVPSAILTGIAAVYVVAVVPEIVLADSSDWISRLRRTYGLSDYTALATGVTLGVVSAWVLGSLAFHVFRWRRVVQDPRACRFCGYDLTGNVSGVCPECGERI